MYLLMNKYSIVFEISKIIYKMLYFREKKAVMKKKLFNILFFLLISTRFFSQETCIYQSFNIKINDPVNVPIVTKNTSDNTVILTHKEQYITDIFSKYVIYNFYQSHPNANTEALRKYYTIKSTSKDLINELYTSVPKTIFNIESNFEGTTFNQNDVNFFDKKVTYNLTEYIATSDTAFCVFNCDLKSVPEGFKISVRVYYDALKELLIIENLGLTFCENSFTFKLKKKVNNSENGIILWESISEKPCFDASNSINCQIEWLFFETLKSNFNLTFSLDEDSFIIKTPNGVFGENVFHFEEESLSINDEKFSKSILISQNPAKDFIKLKIKQQEIIVSNISIFDFSGRKLISTNNSINKIDISSLSSGIYFLQVETSKGLILKKKIIKE